MSNLQAQPQVYTVVVAEDEALIRELAVDILTDEGFRVLEAAHAAEALQLLHVHADDVHLLFTDIHMPGEINGLALAHHTRSQWPWIAVLIASGRPAPGLHEMPAGSRFLPKPYHPHMVVTHARELVGAR